MKVKIYTNILFLTLNLLTIIKCLLDYSHEEGELLYIGLGQIKSVVTHLPFRPDYPGFFNLKNKKIINDDLGEIISGSKITESDFYVYINRNQYCKKLNTVTLSEQNVDRTKWLINHDYFNNFYLDKLPSARGYFDLITKESYTLYQGGIPLGYIKLSKNGEKEEYNIFNHFTFKVSLHEIISKTGKKKYEIVGFTTYPSSILQGDKNLTCNKYDIKTNSKNAIIPNYELSHLPQNIEPNKSITFTYDIVFEKSNLTLVSRWDNYLHLSSEIHWFGIINSNLIILIFTLLIIFIFCRAIKKDIDIYNVKVTGEDFIDEYGWKQVCNDVFRKPFKYEILTPFIGNGIQLFAMIFLSLLISIIGVLRPESRGKLLTLMLFIFVLMGFLGGYSSSIIYKSIKGENWLKNAFKTALFYPSIIYNIFLLINFVFIFEGSEPIKTIDIITLLMLWIFCSTPLVLIGAFFGIRRKPLKLPCRVNPCPTFIPQKPWYFRLKYLIWITGLIPFSAIFVEFIYLMASIWRDQIYFLFGFLWIALIVLIIVSSEVSIIVVYLCLCKGDYNWWWKSFLIGGSPVIYIIGYSVYYLFYLNITRFSTVCIYFGAMTIFSSAIFLICGSLSTLFTYIFLIKIYSLIKID